MKEKLKKKKKKERWRQKRLCEKQDKQMDQASFPSAHKQIHQLHL